MKTLSLFIFFAITFNLNSQITRYPYIQSTTTNSTIIAWRTANGVLGSVKYGTDSTNLVFTKTETNTGTEHALLLDNLSENTKYYYQVYSGLDLKASEYFTTAKNSIHDSFSFLQYGDCGFQSQIQKELAVQMEADDAQFAVVCGDVDQGGLPHFNPSEGGDNYDDVFFDIYNDGDSTKMLSRECHYTAIGNHDYYANNGAEYDNAFYLPHNNNENSERYYSFTWGDAKFICLDVITPYDPFLTPPYNDALPDEWWWTDFRQGSPQYNFLIDELKCNDKEWVFVYFHEGPWTNYWGADYNLVPSLGGDYYHWDGNATVRAELVPVFEEYNVDFVLCGHSHLYERGEWNGVTYITSGSAGDQGTPNGTEVVIPHWPQLPLSILQNVYTKISVDNDSVYVQAINKDQSVVDTYSKTKNYIAFNPNPTVTNVSCNGGNNGSVTLNIEGPKPPYKVEWFDGDTLLTKGSLSAGTYFAYVRNVYDCEKIIYVTVEEPPVLIPQIVSTSGSDMFCQGDTISLLTNNQFYDSYNWSTGDSSGQIYLTTEQSVTVTVVSTDGCTGTSAPFTVSYLPNADVTDVNFAHSDTTYNFLATGTNIDNYSWQFGDGTDTTLNNNLISHTYNNNYYYNIELYASNNCSTDTFSLNLLVGDTATGIFELYNTEYLNIYPNPFTDKTYIQTKNLKGLLKVNIYNSQGKKMTSFKTRKKSFVFERKSLENGFYYIEIIDKFNKKSLSKVLIN